MEFVAFYFTLGHGHTIFDSFDYNPAWKQGKIEFWPYRVHY